MMMGIVQIACRWIGNLKLLASHPYMRLCDERDYDFQRDMATLGCIKFRYGRDVREACPSYPEPLLRLA
jgi:hypothetical protein